MVAFGGWSLGIGGDQAGSQVGMAWHGMAGQVDCQRRTIYAGLHWLNLSNSCSRRVPCLLICCCTAYVCAALVTFYPKGLVEAFILMASEMLGWALGRYLLILSRASLVTVSRIVAQACCPCGSTGARDRTPAPLLSLICVTILSLFECELGKKFRSIQKTK